MAKLSIVAGATSQSVNLFIQNSSSTTGAGLTGLVFNTSGLTCYYTFAGANATAVAVTLATLAAVNSAYSSGGFKEIDSTNMPGVYRLDLPNAAIASAKGRSVLVYLQGATNMAPCVLEIELTGWDNQDAVHGGLSCLPNTAVTTNASLLTSGAGTDQLQVASGIASADVKKWLATAVTAATAGIPDVNTKNYNNVAATTDANNLPKVDVEDWKAGIVPAVNVTGVPKVDVVDWLGSAPNALNAGRVDAVANIRSSTAQAGAAGSITLDAGASATNSFYNQCLVFITGGTGVGQVRMITGYTGASKVATVAPNWATAPDVTSTFTIVPQGGVDVETWLGTAVTAASAGIPDVNAKNINNVSTASVTTINANQGTTQPVNFTGAAGAALVKSDTVDIAGAAVATGSAQLGVNVVNIAGAAAALDANNLLKVDVEDVSGAATIAELAQAQPPTNPTLAQALMLLYMATRNALTTTATSKTISNNAGTVICKQTLSDDGTTYTQAKLATGP